MNNSPTNTGPETFAPAVTKPVNQGTVMVVDDCDVAQMIAAVEIEQADPTIAIVEAYDGQEALDKLKAMPFQPDLIFLDINMPRMNGHEFLEAYQSVCPQSRVAMMSSSGLDEDKRRAAQHACVKHYFTKPFVQHHIEQVLPLG